MKLDTFYAYANEATCQSQNRKSQQTTTFQSSSLGRDDDDYTKLLDTAVTDTNRCYHLFQHSLVSHLILIKVLNDCARRILGIIPVAGGADETKMLPPIHKISATCNGDRNVCSLLFTNL